MSDKKQINSTDELPDAQDAGETVGTGNDARIAMLNAINDQNDELQAADLADVNDDGTTAPFVARQPDGTETPLADETVEDEDTTAAMAAVTAETEENNEPEPAAPVVVKHKVKVNGVDREFTTDELIARASKVEAADAYLQEAARIRREAELSAQPKPLSPQDAAKAALDEEREIVRAIQMGEEPEALAAIRKLRAPVPSGMTPDEQARFIRDTLAFEKAADRFGSEYADVMGDDRLRQMAIARDRELINEGDKRPYWERLEAVGKEIRGWKDGLVKKSAPAATADTTNTAKVERKAAAPKVPRSSGAKAPAPVDDDDKQESASDVIANIAKARGGPQWMRGLNS